MSEASRDVLSSVGFCTRVYVREPWSECVGVPVFCHFLNIGRLDRIGSLFSGVSVFI